MDGAVPPGEQLDLPLPQARRAWLLWRWGGGVVLPPRWSPVSLAGMLSQVPVSSSLAWMGRGDASKVPPVGGWHVILATTWSPEHRQERLPSTELGVAPLGLLGVTPDRKLEVRPAEGVRLSEGKVLLTWVAGAEIRLPEASVEG